VFWFLNQVLKKPQYLKEVYFLFRQKQNKKMIQALNLFFDISELCLQVCFSNWSGIWLSFSPGVLLSFSSSFVHLGSDNCKLNSYFITGFFDGEGSFMLVIRKDNKYSIGYSVQVVIQIELHKKDRALLELIQSTWGVGVIVDKKTRDVVSYTVSRLSDLKVVIAHFEKYPLITQKWADYQLLKKAFDIIESKEHLTIEGLKKLVAIKALINWGLSEELKAAFPLTSSMIKQIDRPILVNQKIKDPYWLAGFTCAEGCVFVDINNSPKSKLGQAVNLRFLLTQHNRDTQLLISFINYLDCGRLKQLSKRDLVVF